MAWHEDRKPVSYCSSDALRKRGWTPFLVRAFLMEPDLTVRGEPLYLTSRVRGAERTPEFAAAVALRRRRAEALRAASARRRERALDAIRTVRLDLPLLSPAELVERAVRHRNLRDARRAALSWGHRPSPVSAESAVPAELARWQVEYLRDVLARHALLVEALPPGSCRAEGRRLLTERVLGAIAAAYPALGAECRRQRATAPAG
ncbi:hypothetical protein [Streptomyces sp. SBT349]|uniref:hypothetical protein n=1 Tax=Streptomyces sp. SBT349 TaxID=1580539 RepID=UPI00066CB448|nr:hypothetical protein [Streptomyces sp. SBT349]